MEVQPGSSSAATFRSRTLPAEARLTQRDWGSSLGLRVEHPQTKDLKLWLKNPAGTKAVLSDRDTKGANFGDSNAECSDELMRLDADAVNPLSTGSAPYANTFQAAEPLTIYDDGSTLGDWTLTIKDVKAGNKGKLRCFVLSIYGTPN